jgi:enterobactin synthetase component D / holo-[acyl-carrier protein] synthase
MIERLLPAAVATAEAFDDIDGPVFAEEMRLVADAVEQRRREFVTGRICARRALTRLAAPAGPITADRRGAPQWPAGIAGSISHCPGYRAAAVGRSTGLRGIGIDAEANRPLPAGVLDSISTPEERPRRELDVCWDRLLFSAKEAVFKAWYPTNRRSLGWRDVAIHLMPGVFGARLASGEVLTGRWLGTDDLVLTAVTW